MADIIWGSDEINDIIKATTESTGVVMTEDQMREFLELHLDLSVEIIKWEVSDTEVRGQLATTLSYYLMKKRWPTYGDNRDHPGSWEKFLTDLEIAAKANGYGWKE
jgi:hypothetical protein